MSKVFESSNSLLSEGKVNGSPNNTMKAEKEIVCPPEEEGGPEIRIVTGACKVGKVPHQCEDAFFISDRGFGVADGVSGWNDYGFSSSMFSN